MKLTRKNVIRGTGALLVAGVLLYLLLRSINPTSSAQFIFDSPDGKYRCAVFEPGVIRSKYEIGLFRGHWPHRELTGDREKLSYDSVSPRGFEATWLPDVVRVDFNTGYGDDRGKRTGRIKDGTARWE